MTLNLSDNNRRILLDAYDDGVGGGLTLTESTDPPWFMGMYGDCEMCQGIEQEGTLYTIAHASGDGLVCVIVGKDLLKDVTGTVFHNVDEAKAYIQGRLEA